MDTKVKGCDIPSHRAFRPPSRLRKFLRSLLFIRPIVREIKGTLLDIGCGEGAHLKAYHGVGVGLDINVENIFWCWRNKIRVYLSSIEDFQSGEKYDTILLSHVLEHLDKPQDALLKAYSYLKPGGRLIIVLPCLLHWILGYNDLLGHKQCITEDYVDYVLVGQVGCKKIKSSTFPPIPLPYMWQHQEKRLIYSNEVKDNE